MKRTIETYKASPMGKQEAPDLTLHVWQALPAPSTLEETRELFEREARRIVDGLIGSMPGGMIDALLRELLQRKASLLHVTHVDPIDGAKMQRAADALRRIGPWLSASIDEASCAEYVAAAEEAMAADIELNGNPS